MFVRRLGETATPGGGECQPCPDFASYTLAFALQLKKNHEKTSVRVTEGRLDDPQNVVPFTRTCVQVGKSTDKLNGQN